MKCGTTTIKICLSNKLYLKHIIDSYIDDFKKDMFKHLFYNILIVICTVCLIFCALSYGLSSTTIRNIIVVVIVVLVLYSIIKLVCDMNKACTPICNAVGLKDFKKSIELIMNCATDENYEPTTERDIEIMNKLEQLNKEMP